MTDKELLELAAKAAGIDAEYHNGNMFEVFGSEEEPEAMYWNPLTDDGDALRLAVKLNLSVCVELDQTWIPHYCAEIKPMCFEDHGDDPYAATRRAIVRASAEIGKTIGETK